MLSALVAFAGSCRAAPEPRSAACPDCAVRLEYLATVGDGTGEGALDGQVQFVARDTRGRFVVTSHVEPLPYLYDETGAYLGRLGGEGEGPGQFEGAGSVHVNRDSLYVQDRRQGRVLVFDAELDFGRSIPRVLPYYGVVPMADGSFAVNVRPYSHPPLAIYTPTGEVHATMGEEASGDPRYLYLHQPRALAASRSGGIWSVKSFFDPVLREWSSDGELVREVPVDVAWYEPYEEIRELSRDERPRARIMNLHIDASGRIWIAGAGADERWPEGLGEARPGEGDTRYHPIDDPDRVYDTWITVLDGADGRVLFERRFDRALRGIGGPLLIEPRPDDLGFVALDVYEIVVDPPAEGTR